MKFAVLGGSFNPFHNGHLSLAAESLRLGYDRLIFVPAYQSPLKPFGQSANASVRADMVLAAITGDTRFMLDMCEIKRGGISYTIDTVRDITRRYPSDQKIGFIIGDDLLNDFHKWKGADNIANETDLIIARRIEPGTEFPYPVRRLENRIIKLSSEEIRSIISKGPAWEHLIPHETCGIIKEKKLYGYTGKATEYEYRIPNAESGIHAIETFIRRSISTERFVHSKNVAIHCFDLAKKFGLDSNNAYLAGILHDMSKETDANTALEILGSQKEYGFYDYKKNLSVIHGVVAAVILEKTMGFKDQSLIEAVRTHTIGGERIGPLAKIVYIADKIEVGRTTVDPELRNIVFNSSNFVTLDELYKTVYGATRAWLHEHGKITY